MKQLIKISVILALLFAASCESHDDPPLYPDGDGFFILNEGKFLDGNGSVSFYNTETKEIYNDLFSKANNRALGDIPSFLAVDGDRGFIVVNNSGTIEAVNIRTMESLGTITGLDSPRQMVIDGRKGYVSSLNSEEVTVVDLDKIEISGHVDIGSTSEAIVITGGRLFSAHWSGGSSIVVSDLSSGSVITSVATGMEPESMLLDKNGKLWVLCTGGWMGEEIPRIVRINTVTLEKEADLFFRTVNDNPSSLRSNATGDTLYYLDEGVRRMPVTATALPGEAFIPEADRRFYKLLVSPGGIIAVTDAKDYMQKGDFLVYDRRGQLLDTEQAGIIPGFMLHMQD